MKKENRELLGRTIFTQSFHCEPATSYCDSPIQWATAGETFLRTVSEPRRPHAISPRHATNVRHGCPKVEHGSLVDALHCATYIEQESAAGKTQEETAEGKDRTQKACVVRARH